MAIYRTIQMSFWEDTKIVEDFTPEDKYFMLYCLTNSHTNLCGCYKISLNKISTDTGYTVDVIKSLLKRFDKIYNVIKYDYETKELFIKNWDKYNCTKSVKLDKPLLNEIEKVKNNQFRAELIKRYNSQDTVSIPYECPIDTTVNAADTVSNKKEIEKDFEKVWKMYPKKEGKKNAFKHFQKSIKGGATVEQVELGIIGYIEHCKKENRDLQYYKNGSTFFNQETWNDYYEAKKEEEEAKERKRMKENAYLIETEKREKEYDEKLKKFTIEDERKLIRKTAIEWKANGKTKEYALSILGKRGGDIVEEIYNEK